MHLPATSKEGRRGAPTNVTYRGETLGDLVEIYATAFSDMHRELYRFYTSNDFVVVQLALQARTMGLWSCRQE